MADWKVTYEPAHCACCPESKPRTYASLPVETRRRVVGRMVELYRDAAATARYAEGSEPLTTYASRKWSAAQRLASYIVGEKA